MSINLFLTRPVTLSRQLLKNIPKCCYTTATTTATTTSKDIVSELQVEEVPTFEVEPLHDEEEMNKMRDISGLEPAHRNIIQGRKPYDQSYEKFHDSVWYRKKMLGKYGIEAAEFHAGICWPTREEIKDNLEMEKLAYPNTIYEVWKEIEERKKAEAEEIRQKEEEIDKVVANFDKWKAALDAKVAKKEAEVKAAKEKKERLVAEIREHFGYNIDPRDERFKQMLELKEKEDKKKKKEERKKKKEEKLAAWLEMQAKGMMEDKKDSKAKETKKEAAAKPVEDAIDDAKKD